jgi:ectoine hydroxylase-related dioxygenase (phytanoyl-CoA dioxygenase family)
MPEHTLDRRVLGDGEVAGFRDRGYAVCHWQVFAPALLAALRALAEEHLEAAGDPASPQLDTPHFRDQRLLEFLLADEVLDLVEPLTGPDIVLWSSHLIVKTAAHTAGTPWHEDSAYWAGRLTDYSRIVTVWLALDPTWRENGCLRVIPGSHGDSGQRRYRVDHSKTTFEKELERVDESQAVYFELAPGEASLHDGRIIHGAAPNRSGHRRAGYTMRYLPADVRIIPEANRGHRVWLARGQDRAGNTYENA